MSRVLLVVASAIIVCGLARIEAQRGGAPAPPRAPRAGAPIDLTGYWVSIVTQDWRWRMVTPRKGDYQGLQLTPAARKVADAWDPARDEAAGEQCKSYGAPALMSVHRCGNQISSAAASCWRQRARSAGLVGKSRGSG